MGFWAVRRWLGWNGNVIVLFLGVIVKSFEDGRERERKKGSAKTEGHHSTTETRFRCKHSTVALHYFNTSHILFINTIETSIGLHAWFTASNSFRKEKNMEFLSIYVVLWLRWTSKRWLTGALPCKGRCFMKFPSRSSFTWYITFINKSTGRNGNLSLLRLTLKYSRTHSHFSGLRSGLTRSRVHLRRYGHACKWNRWTV